MKLFRIVWAFPNNPIIAGQLKWGLPGIDNCPSCHITGGSIGVEYPAIDISSISNLKPYLNAWAVPLKRLEELREAIRKFFPPELPLPPGAEFGTITGRALAKPGDFAWARMWTPLISESARKSLEAEIGPIKAVPAELKFRGKFSATYYALHIAQYARLHDSCVANRESCPTCGNYKTFLIGPLTRNPVELGKQMKIDGTSIPAGSHIFRIREFKTFIIVTEAFKNAVTRLGLSDIAFIEMNVTE